MTSLLYDAVFWVGVSFLGFIALTAKRAGSILIKTLDRRRETIISDLENAQALRQRAERKLAEERERRATAEEQAEAIVKAAEADIERIRKHTQDEIKATIKRREEQAKTRIAQVEAQAVAEVRAQIASIAVAAAEKVLTDYVRNADRDPLIDQGIQDLPRQLH